MPRRSKCPPWGIRGGTPGEPGGYLLKRPGEKKFTMMGGCHIPVAIGAEAIVRTGGGGGWGDPLERDPALVAHDVAEGFISAAAARKLYGVVVRGNMSLDESATGRLRKRLGSAAKSQAARPRQPKTQEPPSASQGENADDIRRRSRLPFAARCGGFGAGLRSRPAARNQAARRQGPAQPVRLRAGRHRRRQPASSRSTASTSRSARSAATPR